jgi:hypothetical protein
MGREGICRNEGWQMELASVMICNGFGSRFSGAGTLSSVMGN